MKHILPLVALFVLLGLAACGNRHSSDFCWSSRHTKTPNFVSVVDSHFELNDSVWFPLLINYKVDWRRFDDTVVISPAYYYDNPYSWDASNAISSQNQLDRHMQLISDCGFNSVRLCLDVISSDEEGYFYGGGDNPIYLLRDSVAIFSAVDQLLASLQQHNLRALLLIPTPLCDSLRSFARGLLSHLAENPTLWAYDFMNEPLYFDPDENRSKESVFQLVSSWHDMMDSCAPHQLFTVALAEPIEAFEWDFSIMPVDFVEMHTYHPLRVASESYWYAHNVQTRPWIIGETALPADQDSIPYSLQCQFLKETFSFAQALSAAGFGWWEFQDCPQGVNFEAQYTGIFYWDSTHLVEKPVANLFRQLPLHSPKVSHYVEPPQNYYNMLAYSNLRISGRVVDEHNRPVCNAVIRGWNNDWSVGMNTYSDSNGYFFLYSNDYCVHFEVSALGMTRRKFNKFNLSYLPKPQSLYNVHREYQQIDYRDYLLSDSSILTFQLDSFQTFQAEACLGKVKLKHLL